MRDKEYWENIVKDLSPFEFTSLLDVIAENPETVTHLIESSHQDWCIEGRRVVMRKLMQQNSKLMRLRSVLFE
jgi:hypothetical protein